MVLANKATVKVAELFNIQDIEEINTLYYAVAASICDIVPERDGKQKNIPDSKKEDVLQTKVVKARVRVSQLVALKKKNKSPPHLTTY
eukprot:4135045-Ditylum_brightwellii.AAC.1